MARVHSYARFSSAKQDSKEGGTSEWRQKDNALAWIEKNGHELAGEIYLDKAASAFKGKKQRRLEEFLSAVESGEVRPGEILLIEAFDRLSRKGIDETQEIVRRIQKAGVDIVILSPTEMIFKASEAKNNLMASVMVSVLGHQAYTYSANLSGRLKNSWRKRRDSARNDGGKLPANRPAWIIKQEDGSFAVNSWHEYAIRKIFALYLEGKGTLQVLREMNRSQCRSFGGGDWNKVTVRKLVQDRAVLGEFQPHELNAEGKRVPSGEPIPGYYPAIIDEKTWSAANAAINRRSVEKGPSTENVYLLSGLVYSANDGSSMRVYSLKSRTGRMQRRLQTCNASNNADGACRHTIDLPPFEEAVTKILQEIDPSDLSNDPSNDLEIQALNGEIDRKTKRIEELQNALTTDEGAPVPVLLKAIKQAEEQRKGMKEQLCKLTAAATTDKARALRTVKWFDLKFPAQVNRQRLRDAIKTIVQRIDVATYKLGEQKRSPIVANVVVELKNGFRRRFVLYKGKIIYAVPVSELSGEELAGTIDQLRPSIERICKAFDAMLDKAESYAVSNYSEELAVVLDDYRQLD